MRILTSKTNLLFLFQLSKSSNTFLMYLKAKFSKYFSVIHNIKKM